MKKVITPKTFPKYKPGHPLLADLPEFLKNPANYEKIRRLILESIATSCTHSYILEFAKCRSCTEKMLERRALLKRLGFRSPKQFLMWRKVHEKIKERYPLVDWKVINDLRRKEEKNDVSSNY